MLIPFGKYQGRRIHWLIEHDPRYAMWAHKNVWWLNLNEAQVRHAVNRLMEAGTGLTRYPASMSRFKPDNEYWY